MVLAVLRGACSIVDASFLCLSLILTQYKILTNSHFYFSTYNLYEMSCVVLAVLSCFLAITIFLLRNMFLYSINFV